MRDTMRHAVVLVLGFVPILLGMACTGADGATRRSRVAGCSVSDITWLSSRMERCLDPGSLIWGIPVKG